MRFLIAFLTAVSLVFSEVYTVDGLGCDSDLNLAYERAKENALVKAVERAGITIQGTTLVKNNSLIGSFIKKFYLSKAEILKEEPLKDLKVKPDAKIICLKYRFKIKVDTRKLKPLSLGLKIITNKTYFKSGEELTFKIYSDVKCYPYVFNLAADGKVYRLIPNILFPPTPIEGWVKFPTPKMVTEGIQLILIPYPQKPFPQQEELIFICSLKRIKALEDSDEFPTPIITENLTQEEIEKRLKKAYLGTLKRKLFDVLIQEGIENFDFTYATYFIIKEKK